MRKINDLLIETYKGDDYSEDKINHNEILVSVIRNINRGSKKNKMRNKLKTMLIAACITVFVGAGVVFATQYINLNLVEFFGFSQEEQSEIANGIQSPECTVTKNGVTVNIIQTLSDGRNLYVIYEVLLPEDMNFNNKINFEGEVCHNNVGTYTCTLEQNENKRVMMKHLNFDKEIRNEKLHLTFMNLKNDDELIVAGEWDLKWAYDEKKITQTKTIYPQITIKSDDDRKMAFLIDKITISPFSVLIDCFNEESKMPTDNLLKTDIVLYFKNGEKLNTDEMKIRSNRGFIDNVGKVNFYFDQYIDINSLEKISIGDAAIELN